jgi:diaminopimelate decarboxylase
VVEEVFRAGCAGEVSSGQELAVARAAGPEVPLLFTGPGKSDAELAAALAAGALLSCESATELRRVASRAGGPTPVLLRLQPPGRTAAGLSMGDGRQFGFLPQEAVDACRAGTGDAEVAGFHVYLGSQLPGVEALLAAFGHAVEVVTQTAEAAGVTPRAVDLGGGFPWPYAVPGTGADLAGLADGLAATLEPLTRTGCRVWFESGRRLVAAAGRLAVTVVDVKERGGTTIVVVDGGVNVLGGMSGLGRVMRPATVAHNLTSPDGPPVTVDIVGPLCTPLDRLAHRTVAARPRPGDVLGVDNVGAYGASASLAAFLSRAPASEVVVDGERVLGVWALRHGHERLDRTRDRQLSSAR